MPLFVEGVDQDGPFRGDGRGARDDVPQAGCHAFFDGQGEALVRFGRQTVDAGDNPLLQAV